MPKPLIQGSLWKIFSVFCFVVINSIIRYQFIKTNLHPTQLAFISMTGSLLGLCIIWLWKKEPLFFYKPPPLLTSGARALCAAIGSLLWFQSLKQFPLALLGAFKLMSPFISILGAKLFLKETWNWTRFLSLIGIVIGASLLLAPSSSQTQARWQALYFPLGALLCFSSSHILGKKILKQVSSSYATFWLLGLTTPLLGLSSMPNWQSIQWTDWPWLFMTSLFGTGAYYGLNRALELADITYLMPFSLFRFAISYLISLIFFGEYLGIKAWIGVGLIIGTSLYLTNQESRTC